MSDTSDTPIIPRLAVDLRNLAESLDDGNTLGDLPLGFVKTLDLLTEAADEIERLLGLAAEWAAYASSWQDAYLAEFDGRGISESP